MTTRRRSVQFMSLPTTVVVPGLEEKEHRRAAGDGPAVRHKEVYPGKSHDLIVENLNRGLHSCVLPSLKIVSYFVDLVRDDFGVW